MFIPVGRHGRPERRPRYDTDNTMRFDHIRVALPSCRAASCPMGSVDMGQLAAPAAGALGQAGDPQAIAPAVAGFTIAGILRRTSRRFGRRFSAPSQKPRGV